MSDLELQIELAKMLPEKMVYDEAFRRFHWLEEADRTSTAKKVSWPGIQNTEWLHVCWLIEQDIATRQKIAFEKYQIALEKTVYGTNNQLGWITRDLILATWQQRARALIAVTIP